VRVRAQRVRRERAETVIAAYRDYERREGQLPNRLEDLVPSFLPSVPPARRFGMGRMMYIASPGQHSLMYVVFPPFGRSYYQFEQDRWGALD
jgi:hypothetical protein